MRICLVNPPQVYRKSIGTPYVFEPLGLGYIASILEKDHDVFVIDAALEGMKCPKEKGEYVYLGLSPEDIKKKISKRVPDVVGISVPYTLNSESAMMVASAVKEIDKEIITVMGGAHTTARPQESLKEGNVDYVVIGEGEETVNELVKYLLGKGVSAPEDIKGIGFRRGRDFVVTGARPPVRDLDALPFPAWHLFDMDGYFRAASSGRLARKLNTYSPRSASIVTTRGCPYDCNFCSIHLTMGFGFRMRSPDNVVREIEWLVKEYGVRHINFEDDNLTLKKSHACGIFDLIIQRKLDISWSAPNGIRADKLDEELVIKMKSSGAKRVFLAPESGSQRVVNDIIGKRLDLKSIEKALRLLKRHGIAVDGSFVIGLIGETKAEILKTILYALKLKLLGLDKAGIHIATPYYGTGLYKEAIEKGLLKKDLKESDFSTSCSLIETKEWSHGDIMRYRDAANWLINYGPKDKIAYILIHFFPFTWGFLRAAKRVLRFMAAAAGRIFAKAVFWSTLLSKAIAGRFMQLTGRLPGVEYLVYEVTDFCNSRCKHCRIWTQKPSPDILTPAELEKILSDDFFRNLKSVLLTGGEPVLHKEIKEIIETIHRVRPSVKMTLSTNGVRPEMILDVMRFTVSKEIPMSVGISLDAVGPRHDELRGVDGNYKSVDYLIDALKQMKDAHSHLLKSIVIGHTLSNITYDTLREVYEYSKSKDVAFLTQLYEEFDFYNNISTGKEERLLHYGRLKNENLIKALEYLPPSFHNEVLMRALTNRLRYRCASMRTFCVLRADGSISPCLKYGNIRIKGVREKGFAEAWRSNGAREARKTVARCRGCSNSWAVDWSFLNYCVSFLKTSAMLAFKRSLIKGKPKRKK